MVCTILNNTENTFTYNIYKCKRYKIYNFITKSIYHMSVYKIILYTRYLCVI